MTHLQKLRKTLVFKWVSFTFIENHLKSSELEFRLIGSISTGQNPKHYGTKGENFDQISSSSGETAVKFSRATLKEAQAALLEYLHFTRGLLFMDAEHMSKHSPHFLEKVLKRIRNEDDVRHSIVRFLRYHPINEFEPFFESLGLEPFEYTPLLPRDLMFLSDDDLLLENYHVFCNYGIARSKIGRIYKDAREVFKYELGVLPTKLQAYEKLGLSKAFVAKVIVCSPKFLIGDVNVEFVKVLKILKSLGFEFNWINEHLSEENFYNWSLILRVLSSFMVIGFHEEQLGRLISQHPGLLFEGSGRSTLSLIGFLLKFGSTLDHMCSMFLEFPLVQVGKFVLNMRHCFMFLNEIEMEADGVAKIISSHSLLLGSSALKKTNTLLAKLNTGKKRLCQYIQNNPEEMKKWVWGSKIEPLPNSWEEEREQKLKFLLDLGFKNNSEKMEKACMVFRGKGGDLQERFNCIVDAGVDRMDVVEMVKVSPQILNQTKDVIMRKIDFLVNNLGCPLSTLVAFPSYLDYTSQRVKLRLSMYNWLKDQGRVVPNLSLSTLVSCSEPLFVSRYVNLHPAGLKVWQELKEQIYSD